MGTAGHTRQAPGVPHDNRPRQPCPRRRQRRTKFHVHKILVYHEVWPLLPQDQGAAITKKNRNGGMIPFRSFPGDQPCFAMAHFMNIYSIYQSRLILSSF
jgi:hypothetical protein